MSSKSEPFSQDPRPPQCCTVEPSFNRTTETSSIVRPTAEINNELLVAYDRLNRGLIWPVFGVVLPQVMLTLQWDGGFIGRFVPKVWSKVDQSDDGVAEIALNPRFFDDPIEVFLVSECRPCALAVGRD